MELLTLLGQNANLTRNQRLGHLLTLMFAVFGFFIGLSLRNSILYETVDYFDPVAGIRLNYPTGWLVDTTGDEYVFRVQDISRVGYKTTMQITTVAVAAGMQPRNILDNLSLTRSNSLSRYSVLLTQPDYLLPNGETATLMEYTFVEGDQNPFQESIPVVIFGRDLLVLRRSQAILITFRADARTYQTDLDIFQRFLTTLDY